MQISFPFGPPPATAGFRADLDEFRRDLDKMLACARAGAAEFRRKFAEIDTSGGADDPRKGL